MIAADSRCPGDRLAGQVSLPHPLTLTQQYVREGRVIEVPWNGTRAVMATAEHLEYVKSMRPPVGQRYSHRRESQG